MLDKHVTEERLAWENTTITSSRDFTYRLSRETIEELLQPMDGLSSDTADAGVSKYANLKRDIERCRKDFLDDGYGVVLIDGLDPRVFPRDAQRSIYRIIGEFIGTLVVQNARGEEVIAVRDTGTTMDTGGRYHQTKEGGSLHTDSPQFSEVPDYIGLLCIHGAKSGGASRFVSAYTVHNRMLKEHPELLPELYDRFHFDKRGDHNEGESRTTHEPIFTYDGSELRFRYLADYVKAGHEIAGQPLSEAKKHALQAVDMLLEDESLVVQMSMAAGQIQFINNHRTIHGRTAFEDYPDEERKRNMTRMWLKRRNYR